MPLTDIALRNAKPKEHTSSTFPFLESTSPVFLA